MEFYSHNSPLKKMVTHLTEVKLISENMVPPELNKVNEIISITHDFGKYTTYFQNYLLKNDQTCGELKNHAFISAILAAYICLNVFGDKSNYPLIAYNCVVHHHGSLKNPEINLPSQIRCIDEYDDSPYFIQKVKEAQKQLENIKKNKNSIIEDYEKLNYGKYVRSFLEKDSFDDVLLSIRKIDFKLDMKNKSEDIYFVHQMLYSALISADKLSASNTKLPDIKFASYESLDEARIDKCSDITKDINKIRRSIFSEVNKNIEKMYNKSDIFSITAPTGTGKTYTGFFAALKLNQLLGENRKIIYSLPFTSIIEQNYKVIYELFKKVDGFKDEDSTYIIKHHNLSNVDYNSKDNNYDLDQAEILIENWNSGIVITTFVQLFQTLIGTRNKMLKKFDSIRNSIIILDEIQALDIKYYKLIDNILRWSCKYLNCKIIFMTATKPVILKDAIELLENNRKYFNYFNRTRLIIDMKPKTIEQFLEEFNDKIEDKSYLIVCNTISQSLKIYNKLKLLNREVIYLSTNLLPVHRRNIIKRVRDKLKSGEKLILVSTQVVEAGVDLDFDTVIRDIGPLDSIIQCAGRGNRNFEKDLCNVYVNLMVNENNNSFGSMVYGKTLINITKDIFRGSEFIYENSYFELIQKYFEMVDSNVENEDASNGFLKSIKKLHFGGKGYEYDIDKFSLIKDNPNYVDVFFRIDDEAEKTYKKFLKMIKENNMKKKRKIYLEIKNKIRDYTLSLPIKIVRDKFEGKFIMNVPIEVCDFYYDKYTGYKRDENDTFMVF
jgi:CRISPR-associated endonuclease/helicase Cas3